MLDKSVPYKNIIMKIDANSIDSLSEPGLPQGFSFRYYEDGDEIHWARIETSVLEFNAEKDAYKYFKENYSAFNSELKKRCIFALNSDGLPIATATAWYDMNNPDFQALLHWVAVCPEYQGKGIGESIIKKALLTSRKYDAHGDIILHTQSWSHKAVCLYHKLGFIMMKTETLDGCENDFKDALKILKDIIPLDTYLSLMNTAK